MVMTFAFFDLLPLTLCINCSFLHLGLYEYVLDLKDCCKVHNCELAYIFIIEFTDKTKKYYAQKTKLEFSRPETFKSYFCFSN